MKLMRSSIVYSAAYLAALCDVPHALAFSLGGRRTAVVSPTRLESANSEGSEPTRKQFLSAASAFLVSAASSRRAFAEDDLDVPTLTAPTKVGRSINKCIRAESGSTNCVSTSNVKQVDLYSPPWTFEVSPDEAFARLKGAIASDSSLKVTEIDEDARYIKFEALGLRSGFSKTDEVEFLVKGDDKVVTFKSIEKDAGGISDFGAQRSRLEELRKKSGVFGVMGSGLTADSYGDVSKGRGGGALGQLKAFYGLQSGAGFEDVFDK